MVSVPFAGVGVIGTLVLTGTTLNLYSFMGIIVLIGVVVNNAIVLVDYANMLRNEQGMNVREAVVESARRRLRPILMTTLTTILALMPTAIASGSNAETQTPLARVVVGGMTVSTLVTLLVPEGRRDRANGLVGIDHLRLRYQREVDVRSDRRPS
jgi:HAE1 family hydrophobic/amphiphilic exporter-1